MSERLSTAEAAKTLGVHVNTVKQWIGQVPVPAEKDGAGRWRFSPEALEVLQAVKELRDQDRTFDTIRRRIDKRAPGDQHSEDVGGVAPDKQPPGGAELGLVDSLAAAVVPRMVEAIAAQTDLAEKYARAAHRIGELEATLRERERELAEVREKVAQLEAPKPEQARRPWWRLGL